MSLLRTRGTLDRLVVAPDVQSALGPVCLTCGRVVDSESLVEGYPGSTTYARVLVTHHGAEELRTFDMGSSNWDEQDLASLMRRTNWFDPEAFEGIGLGRQILRPDMNEPDDEERAPMVTVPK